MLVADKQDNNGWGPASVGLMFGIFALLYFGELSQLSFSIDEELVPFRLDHTPWIAQGRWATFLTSTYLLSQSTAPFFPTAFFGACVTAAYILVLRAFGAHRPNVTHYLAFPVFAGFPTWLFLTEFSSNLVASGLGLLLTSSAVWLTASMFARMSWSGERRAITARVVLAALALAAALGFYQSFLLAYAAAVVVLIVFQMIYTPVPLRRAIVRLISAALVAVAGLVFYSLILRAFLGFYGLKLEYIQNFARFEPLLADPMPLIGASLREARGVYSGSPYVYGVALRGLVLVPLFGFLAVLAAVALRRDPKRLVIGAGLLAIALIIPFAQHPLALGGFVPYRALVGVPFVAWGLVWLALNSHHRWIRGGAIAAAVATALHTLFFSSQIHAVTVFRQEHDRALAAALFDAITKAQNPYDPNAIYRVDIFGARDFRPVLRVPADIMSARSFFSWDGGNPEREISYMRLIGYSNLRTVRLDERQALLAEYQQMPVWPNTGSVKKAGDITLIKLGPTGGVMHQP